MDANFEFLSACIPNGLETVGAPRIFQFLQVLRSKEASLEKLAVQGIVKKALVEREKELIELLNSENWVIGNYSSLIFCDTPEVGEFILKNMEINESLMAFTIYRTATTIHHTNSGIVLFLQYPAGEFPVHQILTLLAHMFRKNIQFYVLTFDGGLESPLQMVQEVVTILPEFEEMMNIWHDLRVISRRRGTLSITLAKM